MDFTWTVARETSGNQLLVNWNEKTAWDVEPTTQSGFGSKLIEISIPGAKVERNFQRDGLKCALAVPLDATDMAERAVGPA